ncbi:ATP-binding cassette domain-containing protein [Alkalilimnicola sp. S0819]|uniref:ABC transporter ATP-binding protein n=1 Tax=Alkalilimnicola sp. S0819 TaxID=2613922 RepID=UPI0012617480|nr:ATP-binding cassette domain-containing protein [Alkalilimnicola sp. S0819]KAB7624031.1 ATP-binding cassette domain-containing protein [Alkalilimnicola sp. S0819]MPQ16584.1 ATP-binding cassette domain-containing protein [Alkalilimnicola sp. S0819]
MPLLQLHGLGVGQLAPVNEELAAAECLCLSGPSGSGKSRLLRAIADLDPHEGEARLEGLPAHAMPAHRWRARVAYLPAESAWWADTVGAHFPAGADGLPALGLGKEALGWSVARLSSGERQRLALLRVAALAPAVMLLDEPTANLDADSAAAVEAWLADWRRRGVAQIWVSHDPAQIRRVADRWLRIEDGALREVSL